MASSAFRGPPKYFHLVFRAHLRNVRFGIKILMNMAALTIFIYHSVVLYRREIPVKRFLDYKGITAGKDQRKDKNND